MRKLIFLTIYSLFVNFVFAQTIPDFRIHSHNDYFQNIPFYKAVAAGASSVEADVFLVDSLLMVAHTEKEIEMGRDLQSLYLDPLQRSLEMNLGLKRPFQLLIDIKTEAYATLEAIIKAFDAYPTITANKNISIVISGNRPAIEDYVNYPDYIFFDYQSLNPIASPAILNKIALISLSFKNLSDWNGKGRLTHEDHEKVTSTVKKAHAIGKPFRFWATPDSKTAWKAFVHIGVDFINTDMPFECAAYLKTLNNREYRNMTFSEVYQPTYVSDKAQGKVRNVILMIGDGNGLTQISATALANKGELSLTQLKSIGFLKTQSADDFTTDSAGAATAIATGEKARNRAIGVDTSGVKLENITELLFKNGFISGVVTTDGITGATPSSFYAHQKDRSLTEEIINDLPKSKLSLFIANGNSTKSMSNAIGSFVLLPEINVVGQSKEDKIGAFMPSPPVLDQNYKELANATVNALQFMQSKDKPFFLMVEGAKIDSYGHENDIGGVIAEGIGFDMAVTEVLKFADTDSSTLVIITADHETGGLTIPQGNMDRNEIEGDFTTHDHTGTMVPVFAYGPHSFDFQGVYENNELFHKIIHALELKE
ncbi:MAG: alkaline phosphatase [Pricia sp.]|nr:alkaline phosphatase [Pricia sp.]